MNPVRAVLHYSKPTGPSPRVTAAGPGHPEAHHDFVDDPRDVDILDARPVAHDFRLDDAGFRLIEERTIDREAVASRGRLFAAMETLVRACTGAREVLVFDPTHRSTGTATAAEASPIRPPVLRVHAEFTHAAAENTIRDLLGARADAVLGQPFAIVQVWKPLSANADACPLAVADARSVAEDDVVRVKRMYPGWTGEMGNVAYAPSHRWYWFPRMRPDEAILFKGYDSRPGVARWTLHSAFHGPATEAAVARESIELRAVVWGLPDRPALDRE